MELALLQQHIRKLANPFHGFARRLRNVVRTACEVVKRSGAIRDAMDAGQVMVVGALYDVKSGEIEIFTDPAPPEEVLASQQS